MSQHLDKLRHNVEVADKTFCLLHKSISEFYGSWRDDPIVFVWSGTNSPWHDPISLTEAHQMAQILAGVSVTHAMLMLTFLLDGYMCGWCKELPGYASTNDQSWWTPDMIETISGVKLETIDGYAVVSKLYRMREVAFMRRSYTAGIDDIGFLDLLSAVKTVVKFAEDFELAFLMEHPEVKI